MHDNGLSFATLRAANLQRLPQFKNAKGERSHPTDDGSDWTPAEWLQAVVGELGEAANVMKKIRRGDMSAADVVKRLVEERWDVAYRGDVVHICYDFNVIADEELCDVQKTAMQEVHDMLALLGWCGPDLEADNDSISGDIHPRT